MRRGLGSAAAGVRLRRAAPLAIALALAPPGSSGAQSPFPTRWQGEARVDAIFARLTAVHAGLGASVPLGYYVRLEGVVAGGASRLSGVTRTSGRADLVGRFLLDPFFQYRRGPYAGGGLSYRADRGARGRVDLVAVIGVEGTAHRGWMVAAECGVGGGVRVGMALRRAREDRR